MKGMASAKRSAARRRRDNNGPEKAPPLRPPSEKALRNARAAATRRGLICGAVVAVSVGLIFVQLVAHMPSARAEVANSKPRCQSRPTRARSPHQLERIKVRIVPRTRQTTYGSNCRSMRVKALSMPQRRDHKRHRKDRLDACSVTQDGCGKAFGNAPPGAGGTT